MAALPHVITVTLDDRFRRTIDRLHAKLDTLLAEREAPRSSGAAAAIAGALVVAGSSRRVVSRRRLLTFGLRG